MTFVTSGFSRCETWIVDLSPTDIYRVIMKQLQRDRFDAFWGIWSDRSTMWKGLVQISWIPQFRKTYVCLSSTWWWTIGFCFTLFFRQPKRYALVNQINYFTSSYPHHDIFTFCYWQVFWHSIWHIFWHIFWHSIWHSIWQIFWHFILHIFGHSIWHIFWHSTWHLFWQTFWHFIWHTFWHSIWHSIWHTFWHSIWHIFWHFIWHIFGHSIWPLRSSGAHWARRSQVEVQPCSLSSGGPRLRSTGAHWARTVPGWGPAVLTELGRSQVEVQQCPVRSDPCSWGPAVPTACGSWRRAWRRVGKAEVNMGVDAKVVEEKLQEREEKEEEKKNNSDKI